MSPCATDHRPHPTVNTSTLQGDNGDKGDKGGGGGGNNW